MRVIGVILSEQGRLVTVFGFTQPNGSSMSGYVELNIGDDVKYSLGDYYNHDDGKFYQDASLRLISGTQTNSQLYQNELSALSVSYQDGVASLATAYNTAALTDGATQVSKQAALQTQYTSLKSAFVAAVAALKTKYGV